MSRPLFFLPQGGALAEGLAQGLGAETGALEQRRFPDGESYLRVATDPRGRDVVVVHGLERPDEHALPLLLLADTLRDLGAARIGLVAPYLAYMRQDARFRDGEGVTSRYFAAILSRHFDWLATVDPHLHRHASLADIYTIPALAVAAMPAVAAWIGAEVRDALVIGPDRESEQWASRVAAAAGCAYRVLEKTRLGDRRVEIRVPPVAGLEGRTPVLVDDIISSGHTMMETARCLVAAGFRPPVAIGVHAVFAPGAADAMRDAPLARVVTCDTIAHPTNAIALAPTVAGALRAAGFVDPPASAG